MGYQRPKVQELGTTNGFLNPILAREPKAVHVLDWRIKRLKEFIDTNNGRTGWNFDDICKQLNLGISGRYAGRLFERAMKIGLREYAMRQRLWKAADKLRNTTCSSKEIAGDLGYRSPRDLARGFKKMFHLSPSEYRRIYHLAKEMWAEHVRFDSACRNRPAVRKSLSKTENPSKRWKNDALPVEELRPKGEFEHPAIR